MFKDSELAESTMIHIFYPLLFVGSGIAAKILMWVCSDLTFVSMSPLMAHLGEKGSPQLCFLPEMFFI